jgi:hypothetical protein
LDLELIEEKVFLERKLFFLVRTKSTYGIEEKVASTRKNLERELDWVRQGQRTSNETKKRLQNYDKLLNEDRKH